MGRLVYSMRVSLDGFIEDASGGIDFSAPDDVHAAANDQTRAAALLYGRRLFEAMEGVWTDAAERLDLPDVEADLARAYVDTPRYVFSDILNRVPDDVTLVRSRDAHGTVARLKDEVDGPLYVGGAHLAGSILDLVDEFAPVVFPVVLGTGKQYWPRDTRLDLHLVDAHTFASGVVRLRYVRAG